MTLFEILLIILIPYVVYLLAGALKARDPYPTVAAAITFILCLLYALGLINFT